MTKRSKQGSDSAAASRRAALTALEATSGGGAPPRARLSEEERFALDSFVAYHDYEHTWKARLRDLWEQGMGDYGSHHPHAASVLQRLRNVSYFGPRGLAEYKPGPVPETFDADLRAYLDAPSAVRWETIYTRVIPGATMRTLWQAWIATDGGAPTSKPVGAGFPSFPDAFTLRRAVEAARKGQVPVGLQALDAAHARAPTLTRMPTRPRRCVYCDEPIATDEDVIAIGPDPDTSHEMIEAHADCHAEALGVLEKP